MYPPLSSSSRRAKMDGESKSGKHNQSILPNFETNPAERQFPITP